jgi:hypothetical protein
LSLLPSIERLSEMYEPLKFYFLNEETPKEKFTTTIKNFKLLKSFFVNNNGLCTLNFLENVLVDIQRAELKLQRACTLTVDLYSIITNLIKKLEQRLNDKYFGNKTYSILNQLKDVDKNKAEELQQSFELFIKSVIEYINSYFDHERKFYEKLSVFDCQSVNFLKAVKAELLDIAMKNLPEKRYETDEAVKKYNVKILR